MSEEILEKYCQFILNKYEHIRSLDEHVTLTMKDYMPLQCGEERERLIDKRRDEQGDRKEYHEDFRVWREEHSAHKEYSLTPVEVWQAIKNKKIVVKGDPGSGKTTLTQYIAYTLCTQKREDKTGSSQDSTSRTIPTDLLPLVIDLKDWTGKSLSLSEYYIRHVLKDSGLEKEIKPLIDEWLTSGRYIILFDGLDEVPSQERESLFKTLLNLTSGTYGNCHFVVTTRIVGYSNELSGWQHYEVMSLKDEHIKNYVQSYLKGTSTDFLTALKNTPQMSPFSRNPLLLHVLCFVFKKQKLSLPTQRIELYHQAVHEMLKLRNPEIPESVKEKVLKEIAIYFLAGKEIFEEDFLRKILRAFLNKEGERHNEDDVLKEIVEKSALLCRFGDGRYIFLHLTFQEYMAGCYIAEKKENPSQFLEPVLFNPRFREVIRHTAGMLGSAEDIKQFVEFVLEQKPLCHDILHQPLLLAALCIADIPENKINPALEELGEQILGKLWELWSKTQYDSLRDNINRVFTTNIGCKWARIIIDNLLKALRDEDSRVKQRVAEVLGKLGRAEPEVIHALLKALRDDDSWVKQKAAEALGKLGSSEPEVIHALLKALRDDDRGVRWRAAEALGKLGSTESEVIQALLKALGDEDSAVRERAAEALGNLGHAEPEVIQALLKALGDEDSAVREGAAETLGNLGHAEPEVIQALLNALRDVTLRVRKITVEVLGNLGCTDPEVIQAFLNALRDENFWVRQHVAEVLGELGCADLDVIQTLLNGLKDEDIWVRQHAAEALSKLNCTDPEVIQAILNVLKDKDSWVRERAVKVLGELGCAVPEVIQALLKALRYGDSAVRERAAWALGNLGRADHEVVQAFLKALRDKNFWVRQYAAEALGKLGCADTGVIQALLKMLRDGNSAVRERAAWALGNLGRADPDVIQALLKALRDEDSEVRWIADESLGNLGCADDTVIKALLKALRDEDSGVMASAAESLGNLGCADDTVIKALLKAMRKNFLDVGELQRLVDIKLREGRINLHPQTHTIAADGFFHGKEDAIKKLTRKFPVYLNRTPLNITENDIKEWLLQFENPSQRDLAITLLENIDYYGPERMKNAFCHFCDNILPKKDQSKVIISLLGSLKDSASIVNYTIAEKFMDRNMEALSLETILEKMNPEEKVIVFVDDIIASGKQAVQIFREWLGNEELELEEHHVEPLKSYQIEKFKKFKIYLFFFVGFEDGKQDALKNLRDLGLNIQGIYSFTKLEKIVGCFHGASSVFSNDKERKEAERLAREIGIQLFGDKDWSDEKKAERCLGYGNAQKLIVFFYNTPTATLPILWKEGTYNGKKWAPLFPRREKK